MKRLDSIVDWVVMLIVAAAVGAGLSLAVIHRLA